MCWEASRSRVSRAALRSIEWPVAQTPIPPVLAETFALGSLWDRVTCRDHAGLTCAAPILGIAKRKLILSRAWLNEASFGHLSPQPDQSLFQSLEFVRFDRLNMNHRVHDEGHDVHWLWSFQLDAASVASQIYFGITLKRIAPDPHKPNERPISGMIARRALFALSSKRLAKTSTILFRATKRFDDLRQLIKKLK